MTYLIIALIVMVLICALLIKIVINKDTHVKEVEEAANVAIYEKDKLKHNIEQVLDYNKQDKVLVKQREEHVEILIKTRSKEKVENEVKTIMLNLRDAYNSL